MSTPKFVPPPVRISEGVKDFATGAQRSTETEGLAYHLINPIPMKRMAAVWARGMPKYGSHNWELGFPITEVMEHFEQHYQAWKGGDDSEDHLSNILCNLWMLITFQETKPELFRSARWRDGGHLTQDMLDDANAFNDKKRALKKEKEEALLKSEGAITRDEARVIKGLTEQYAWVVEQFDLGVPDMEIEQRAIALNIRPEVMAMVMKDRGIISESTEREQRARIIAWLERGIQVDEVHKLATQAEYKRQIIDDTLQDWIQNLPAEGNTAPHNQSTIIEDLLRANEPVVNRPIMLDNQRHQMSRLIAAYGYDNPQLEPFIGRSGFDIKVLGEFFSGRAKHRAEQDRLEEQREAKAHAENVEKRDRANAQGNLETCSGDKETFLDYCQTMHVPYPIIDEYLAANWPQESGPEGPKASPALNKLMIKLWNSISGNQEQFLALCKSQGIADYRAAEFIKNAQPLVDRPTKAPTLGERMTTAPRGKQTALDKLQRLEMTVSPGHAKFVRLAEELGIEKEFIDVFVADRSTKKPQAPKRKPRAK